MTSQILSCIKWFWTCETGDHISISPKQQCGAGAQFGYKFCYNFWSVSVLLLWGELWLFRRWLQLTYSGIHFVCSICVPLRKQKRWVQSEKVRQFIHIYCVTSEPESKSHKCSSFTLQVCHTFDVGGFCAILLKKNDLWGTLLVVDTKCAFKYLQSIISSIFVLKCYAYPFWPQKYAWLTGRSSLRVVILFFRVQIIVFWAAGTWWLKLVKGYSEVRK